jgi:hypothetical protein
MLTMNYLSKIIPLAILAIVTLATSSWGQKAVHGAVMAMADAGSGDPAGSGKTMMAETSPAYDRGRPPHDCEAPHHEGFMRPMGTPPGAPARLAMHFGAFETEIGIRASQLDAWRDFTDAMLAVMKKPPPPQQSAGDQKAEPFALAQHLADNAIARAQAAETLQKAIQNLRSKLTPDQLTKVAAIEAKIRWRMRDERFGPPDGGARPGPDEPGDGPASTPE